jgi:beta-phosphoglucomutase-like phosphatase (HAD superfamily)
VEAVRRIGARWPHGLASSTNPPLIDLALDLISVAGHLHVTVSSEEVERGKPAPDVYLEAARRLGVRPENVVAIEDSANGIRSAEAAGMRVIAIPNPHFPPPPDVLAEADLVLESLSELRLDAVESASSRP